MLPAGKTTLTEINHGRAALNTDHLTQTSRRSFLATSAMAAGALALGQSNTAAAEPASTRFKPMAMGLLTHPFPDPEERIALVAKMGFPT
jgi:hypothetical protein